MLKSKARRLALYLGACELAIAEDARASVTSEGLSDLTGINATQIRRDLSAFGKLGKRGVGYRAEPLAKSLAQQLDDSADLVHGIRFQAEVDVTLLQSAAAVL